MAGGYLAQVQALIDQRMKENPEEMKRKLKEIERAKKEAKKAPKAPPKPPIDAQLTQELIEELNFFYDRFELKNIKTIKSLIQRGADVKEAKVYGFTVLHLASYYNDMELIKICLECGIDINSKDTDFRTPLHILVGFNSGEECLDSTLFFIEKGAEVNANSLRIGNVLDWAYEDSVIDLLKKHGATE